MKKEKLKFNGLVFGGRDKYKKLGGEYDFYPTPDWAIREILKKIKLIEPILEPCNGKGNITKILKEFKYKNIKTLDIDKNMLADEYIDFLQYDGKKVNTIITNPPYKTNNDVSFIKKALECCNDDGLVIMLLKLSFLESKRRKLFFNDNPIFKIYVHSKRIDIFGKTGICYAWFIWKKGYKGDTILNII